MHATSEPGGTERAQAHADAEQRLTLAEAFTWQAARCAASGSPVAGRLLEVCAETAPKWAPLAGLDHAIVRFGDHIPLRVMAALHYLALTRDAGELPLHLPTLGGTAPASGPGFASAVHDTLTAHPGTVADFLARPPQTNEPGRQEPLRAALRAAPAGQPVDLVELACSAGLNLSVDASSLPGVAIASRRGCDLHPVDAATTEGRALLSSYVWVDDTERFARLGAAITAAGRHRPAIEQADAAAFLDALNPRAHHTTLVWQSALEPYLSTERAAALRLAVDALAARLPTGATLVYATWEDAGDTSDPAIAFALRARTWSGTGAPQVATLARGSAHGALAAKTGALAAKTGALPAETGM